MLLGKQMSIFPVWEMATYPKWQICKSYPIVCMWLHTGHEKQPFALKGCRNPARHIFPWLPGEAVGLHTGVLTKTFAMSVLYLKTIDFFSKENRLISLYIKREKTQVRSNHIFHSVTLRIYIHMIENSRYSIKPQKNYFRRRRRRRVAPSLSLSSSGTPLLKSSRQHKMFFTCKSNIMSSRDRRVGHGRTATGAAEK